MTIDPGTKYADRVSDEFRMAMHMVVNAWGMVKAVEGELRKVDEAERRSHALGPILDPTLYRDQINSKQFAENMKVLRAALTFLDAMKEVEIARGMVP